MKRLLHALTLAALLALPAQPARAEAPLVFAAASTTNLLDAAIGEFDPSIRASYASSSVLAKQLAQGAPAGLFLSANQKWMDYMESQGRLVPGTRRDLLANRLVLIAPASAEIAKGQSAAQAIGQHLGEGRLALGDPGHVPAGVYAKQALTSLGLWEELSGQLAPMHHVRAALAMVERGECPLGVVYATDALVSKKVRVVATFPPESHHPITYPVALITGKHSAGLRGFYDYLTVPARQPLFERFGFQTP